MERLFHFWFPINQSQGVFLTGFKNGSLCKVVKFNINELTQWQKMLVKLFRLLKSDARLANAAAWSYCLQNFLEENSFEEIRSIFALLRSEKTTCYYCYHHRMTLIYAAHAAGRGILALKLIWGQMHPSIIRETSLIRQERMWSTSLITPMHHEGNHFGLLK